MGKEIADDGIVEAGDMVKSTICGCAFFGHQTVNVRMEVDMISESLDHSHNTRHELMACDGVKIFQEGMDGCKR